MIRHILREGNELRSLKIEGVIEGTRPKDKIHRQNNVRRRSHILQGAKIYGK